VTWLSQTECYGLWESMEVVVMIEEICCKSFTYYGALGQGEGKRTRHAIQQLPPKGKVLNGDVCCDGPSPCMVISAVDAIGGIRPSVPLNSGLGFTMDRSCNVDLRRLAICARHSTIEKRTPALI
jgi:hypothetical protein